MTDNRSSNPLVSVCIPVYNVEKWIERCIVSILKQTFSNIEVIVVNDCTPDNSMSIVSSYAKLDDRIHIVNHTCNQGLMMARRTGYTNSKGEFVVFVDSDDELPFNSIELLVKKIMDSCSDVVSGQIQYITKDNHRTTKNFPNCLNYGKTKDSVYLSLLKGEYVHNLCGKIFKRSILMNDSYTTYDHVVNAEDGLLFYQIVANVGKIEIVDDIVYDYYQNEESSTNMYLSENSLRSFFLFQQLRWQMFANTENENLYKRSFLIQTSIIVPFTKDFNISKYLESYSLPNLFSFSEYLQRLGLLSGLRYWIEYKAPNLYRRISNLIK